MPGVGAIGGLTPQMPVIPTNREEEVRTTETTEREKLSVVIPQPEPPETEEAEPEETAPKVQGVGSNLDVTA